MDAPAPASPKETMEAPRASYFAYPCGLRASGARADNLTKARVITSVTKSLSECTASAIIAVECP